MNPRSMTSVLVFAILMLMVLACNLLDTILPSEDVIDEEEIDPVVEESDPDEEEVKPTDTAEPEPTETPEPSQEAWIVMYSNTQITFLREGEDTVNGVSKSGTFMSVSPAPFGGTLAVIRSENDDATGHLWLELYDLHTGEWSTITPLTNDETVINDWAEAFGEANREANIAITYSDPIWTSDGQTLVFIGAQEGRYAKPYAYHLDTGELHDLLLGGEAHYFNPKLSPDDEFITVPCAEQFGTGAGYAMVAFAAARVSGGEATLYMDASMHIDVITWGWLDDHTVVVSGVDMMAGPRNLFTVNIITGEEQQIVSDYVNHAAVATGQGSVLFNSTMSEFLEFVEPKDITTSGLYYWNQAANEVVLLHEYIDFRHRLVWDDVVQCYYAELADDPELREDQVWAITAEGVKDGDCVPISENAQNLPQVAMSKIYIAWSNLGFVNWEDASFYFSSIPEQSERLIMSEPISNFSWHPNDDTLLFISDGRDIYIATAPDFTAQKVIGSQGEIRGLYWVNP